MLEVDSDYAQNYSIISYMRTKDWSSLPGDVSMCGAFRLSKNETMSRWQVHAELPAYVEIFLQQAKAMYLVWLFNSTGVRNYASYNHLISRQKPHPPIIARKFTDYACIMLFGNPTDYAPSNACIIAASLTWSHLHVYT